MSIYLTNKIELLIENGKIFDAGIKTKAIKLDNFQSAKFVISTGEGETATTKARILAVLQDGTEQSIKEQDITIGANTQTDIDVVANELAHYEATSVKLEIDAIVDNTIYGGVVVVLGEPRYAVENNSVIVDEETAETEIPEDNTENGGEENTEEPGTETDPTDENGEQIVE